MVKMWCFHCCSPGLIPGLGTEILHQAAACRGKRKKKKNRKEGKKENKRKRRKKRHKVTGIGEDVETLESLYFTGENVKWCNFYAKQGGDSLKIIHNYHLI